MPLFISNYRIMSFNVFYLGFSIFISNFLNGMAIPNKYCLGRFNGSDCGHAPTPVFTYYKPGSRCEIDIWRGCPTVNMFADEFKCSHFCIGKLLRTDKEVQSNRIEDSTCASCKPDPCDQLVDQGDCGSEPTKVFTYKEGLCVSVEWRGCASANVFSTHEDCETHCNPGLDALDDWKDEIQKLPTDAIEDLKDIIDNVKIPKEVVKGRKKPLKIDLQPLLHIIKRGTTEVPKAKETTTEAKKVEEATTEEGKEVETTTEAEKVVETTTEAVKVEEATTEVKKVEETTTEPVKIEEATTEVNKVEETTTKAVKVIEATTEVEKVVEATTKAEKVEKTTTEAKVTTAKPPPRSSEEDRGSASEVINA